MFKKITTSKKGFTLLELLVSITIFTLLTSTLLVKNAQYKGTTVITNLAYEMALVIRQAQVYGINVRQTSGGSFNGAYGVHFTRNDLTPQYNSETKFRIFADKDTNMLYSSINEDVEVFTLQSGNIIYKYCVTVGGSDQCTGSGSSIASMDILFQRPSPEAIFQVPGQLFTSADVTAAKIFILAPQGICRRIDVTKTGQISVSSDVYRSGEGNTNPCATKIGN